MVNKTYKYYDDEVEILAFLGCVNIGKIRGITFSKYREKAPVYVMGSTDHTHLHCSNKYQGSLILSERFNFENTGLTNFDYIPPLNIKIRANDSVTQYLNDVQILCDKNLVIEEIKENTQYTFIAQSLFNN